MAHYETLSGSLVLIRAIEDNFDVLILVLICDFCSLIIEFGG